MIFLEAPELQPLFVLCGLVALEGFDSGSDQLYSPTAFVVLGLQRRSPKLATASNDKSSPKIGWLMDCYPECPLY